MRSIYSGTLRRQQTPCARNVATFTTGGEQRLPGKWVNYIVTKLGCFIVFALWLCGLNSATAAEGWKAPAEVARLSAPVANDSKNIAAGRALYLDRCADCHGKNGKGHGPGAADLEKSPTNFTDGKCLQQSDGELFWKISEGRRPMPSYRKKLSDEERWKLVFYLRTFSDKP